jgi:hypothetical protein
MLIIIWRDLHAGKELRPFLLSFGVFFTGYLGIAISTWPYIGGRARVAVPFAHRNGHHVTDNSRLRRFLLLPLPGKSIP